MNQKFTIGTLQLIEDEDGFGVAQKTEKGFEVIASFKFPLDALRYFTEYSMTLAELTIQKKENTEKKDG